MATTEKRPTERGARILRRLEEMSWSIAEVVRRSRLTKNTISNVIYGPREPQAKTIELLAETLGLPVEELTRPAGVEVAEAEVEVVGSSPRASVASPSFGGWLLSRGHPALWVGVAGTFATAWVLLWKEPQTVFVQGVHAAVILSLLIFLPRPRVSKELYQRASRRLQLAIESSDDLQKRWAVVWLLWFCLYAVLTISEAPWFLESSHAIAMTPWVLLLLNLVQNAVTISLISCYEIVARPTIRDDFSRLPTSRGTFWVAVVVTLVLGELMCFFFAPESGLQGWFGWVSGFGQGTALALLVGRFDSKYVDPPAGIIGLLYFYAAIQGAWPALSADSNLMVVMTFAALVLKCLLFLFVAWLFESQVIQFYLARMRLLEEGVRRDRSDFLSRLALGDVEDL